MLNKSKNKNRTPKTKTTLVVPSPLAPKKSEPLDALVEGAHHVIFETHSLFPKFLFPDRIVVCLNRVTIIKQNVFLREEYPLLVDSITGASVYRNFWYASLRLETFGPKAPEPLRYLGIKDARTARRYILALIECRKRGIELSGYPVDEIREKLVQIGRVYDSMPKE